MLTMHKITAGDGYLYLLRHTARGDGNGVAPASDDGTVTSAAAAYFTAPGNPPGQWTGRGAHLLGLDGKQVTEDQMKALFGLGSHPDADRMIREYIAEHHRPGMTEKQLADLSDAAIRHATLGSRFPRYETLAPYDDRVQERLDTIRAETGREPTEAEIRTAKSREAHRARAAVAGFDLAFTPVKSSSLLWSVDPRPEVREAIRTAHQRAVADAMDLIEDHAAYTRTGTGGLAQIETGGLIIASFEHWDSRAGDPNLHSHLALSSKVMGADGRWRSLDARSLYRIAIAASECYDTAFEAHLTSLLGVAFSPRPGAAKGRDPVREITGIPPEMIDHFSRRRNAIDARYAELLAWYRKENGREPPAAVARKLAGQATLDTRPAKQAPRSLKEHQDAWRDELAECFGPGALDQVMRAVPDPGVEQGGAVGVPVPDLNLLAERIIASVQARRSTWTRWNIRAESERHLRREMPGLAPEDHAEYAEILTELALNGGRSVCVDAPALTGEPDQLRRPDGESVFREHGAGRFTSHAVLDAEQRLLDATRTPTVNGLSGPSVAAAIDGFEAVSGRRLDPGQRSLVTAFAADGRLLLAGLGPAGSGKTTAMRAYAHVIGQAGRRLVPLATSAASADILGRELGLPAAENLHKFVYEWSEGRAASSLRAGTDVPDDLRPFTLGPGDVVLVDEAGMAGTFLLDRLVTLAAARGATVRLLGDDRQLPSVESGGALRLIASQPGTPELTVLHRFTDPDEAAATLKIRAGDGSAVDWYAGAGRIRSGSRDAMTEAAYQGWRDDMLAGKTTLMAAASGVNVTALSARARADRVAAGQVEPGGVELRDGNRAGAGDWILTRDNQRKLSVHGGTNWVRNGDAWLVEKRHGDGALTVKHLGHHGRVTLPAEYVATHVQLLYASTGHRSQGGTVDTAHPLITEGMTREMLYVLASRARSCTTFYTVTHEQPLDPDDQTDQSRLDPDARAAREVLTAIVATEGNALSATETIETAYEDAGSLARLVPEYLHVSHQHAEARYRDAAVTVLGSDDGQALVNDPAWSAVVRRLYDAEASGWTPEALLKTAASRRELDTADSLARTLSWRIDAMLKHTPAPPAASAPVESLADAKDRLDMLAGSLLGTRCAARARSEEAWPSLIAALHRAEHAGHAADEILTGIVEQRELDTAPSLSELLARRVTRRTVTVSAPGMAGAWAAGQEDRPVRKEKVLPWVAGPPAGTGPVPDYLAQVAGLIAARAGELADRAIRERPAWMTLLGQPPSDPGRHASWTEAVTVIAAYRDQHHVAQDDPHQVLGPYPAEGQAGHKPYWDAAQSVLNARRAAGLERDVQRDNGDRFGVHSGGADAVTAQVAADVYRSLPEAERAEIASAIATQAGPLWLGDPDHPDDDAVVQPAYADQLSQALADRSYLNPRIEETLAAQARTSEPVEASFARRGHVRRPGQHPSPRRPISAPQTPVVPLQPPLPLPDQSGPVPGR